MKVAVRLMISMTLFLRYVSLWIFVFTRGSAVLQLDCIFEVRTDWIYWLHCLRQHSRVEVEMQVIITFLLFNMLTSLNILEIFQYSPGVTNPYFLESSPLNLR